ncbi:hypothetical protein [Acinetobacter cumulans]|uniref:hypothetical protein n=1 Tax=Acinetobacter cumulans TaxID=2136182 RepID=UPI00207759A9|nr:hypothetical protein [Acinetobacter cumulans]
MSVSQKMKLNEAGVTLIDCDHKTPAAQTSGYPYVGIPQLKNGHIRLDGARLISEEDFVLWTALLHKPTSKGLFSNIILK